MAKIRVHELAKEYNMVSKDMVTTLQSLGLNIKNHMSTLEDSQANWIRTKLKSNEKEEGAKEINKNEGAQNSSTAPQKKAAQPPKEKIREIKNGDSIPQENLGNKDNKDRGVEPGNINKVGNVTRREVLGQQQRKPSTGQQRPQNPGQENRKPGSEQQRTSAPGQQHRNPAPGQQRPPAPRQENRTPGSGQQQRPPAPVQQQHKTPAPGQHNRPSTPGQQNRTPGSGQQQRPPAPGQQNRPPGSGQQRPPAPGSKVEADKKKTMPNQQPLRSYARPQKKSKQKKKKEPTVLPTPELITIGENIMVRDLADKMAKSPAEILKKLMELGTMATINHVLDFETVEIIASLFEIKVEIEITEEEKLLEDIIDSEESLEPRPPIVTVMGHVDHGKTSLLDKVREADVASGEAGGITQHIGAYQVSVNTSKITFIDTPGHEAFTAMRARGANLTDIVILVVAADDGVMPQTIEAINHIKAAKVPFVVAVNKMDKPEANPDRIMQQLTEYSIVPEEWGGETIFVPVSAKTGDGIEHLLEMVLLMAELQGITANPSRLAEGVVIEAELDKGKGAVATVLVHKGTLRVGDFLICDTNWCKIRAMTDDKGRRIDKALPSTPVEIMGWTEVPEAGSKVQVCDEKIAKEISSLRLGEKKIEEQMQSSKVSLDDFFKHLKDSEVKELNIIIKGDVQGSIEALAQSLLRLSTDEVKVNVIHSAAGAISETDVMLASASNAIIIGFNVRPDNKARKHAEDEKIDVRLYRIIYEAIEDVKKAMVGLLDPEYKEKYLGRAEVRATFKVPNLGFIAGSYVTDGKILRNANMRILRDGVIIYEGKLVSLRRFKDDVKEVAENYECGIGIKDFNDIKENDIIEAFVLEEVPREL